MIKYPKEGEKMKLLKPVDGEMLRAIKNMALMAIGAKELIEKYVAEKKLSDIDSLLLTEGDDLGERLNHLVGMASFYDADGEGTDKKVRALFHQAADLCFLAYFSRPGQGIKAEMLPVKGKHWVRAIKVAGTQLFRAAGELVSPYAIADIEGNIRIGNRDHLGGMPDLPKGTTHEQRVLAREGIRTKMGIEGQYPFRPVSIAGPIEGWKKALERIDWKLKEERNS
jgi:hypothetical protein